MNANAFAGNDPGLWHRQRPGAGTWFSPPMPCSAWVKGIGGENHVEELPRTASWLFGVDGAPTAKARVGALRQRHLEWKAVEPLPAACVRLPNRPILAKESCDE
jgi:hypothetical protein